MESLNQITWSKSIQQHWTLGSYNTWVHILAKVMDTPNYANSANWIRGPCKSSALPWQPQINDKSYKRFFVCIEIYFVFHLIFRGVNHSDQFDLHIWNLWQKLKWSKFIPIEVWVSSPFCFPSRICLKQTNSQNTNIINVLQEGENRYNFEALKITLRHWKEIDDSART